MDRVQREHERVTITKNGRPAAVLISREEAALAAGDYVEGVHAVRALRAETRKPRAG